MALAVPNIYTLIKQDVVVGSLVMQEDGTWTSYDNDGVVVSNNANMHTAGNARFAQVPDV